MEVVGYSDGQGIVRLFVQCGASGVTHLLHCLTCPSLCLSLSLSPLTVIVLRESFHDLLLHEPQFYGLRSDAIANVD